MIFLITLLFISLGFAWCASLRMERSLFRADKQKFKRWHDYSLLLAGIILIMIAMRIEFLTKL